LTPAAGALQAARGGGAERQRRSRAEGGGKGAQGRSERGGPPRSREGGKESGRGGRTQGKPTAARGPKWPRDAGKARGAGVSEGYPYDEAKAEPRQLGPGRRVVGRPASTLAANSVGPRPPRPSVKNQPNRSAGPTSRRCRRAARRQRTPTAAFALFSASLSSHALKGTPRQHFRRTRARADLKLRARFS